MLQGSLLSRIDVRRKDHTQTQQVAPKLLLSKAQQLVVLNLVLEDIVLAAEYPIFKQTIKVQVEELTARTPQEHSDSSIRQQRRR